MSKGDVAPAVMADMAGTNIDVIHDLETEHLGSVFLGESEQRQRSAHGFGDRINAVTHMPAIGIVAVTRATGMGVDHFVDDQARRRHALGTALLMNYRRYQIRFGYSVKLRPGSHRSFTSQFFGEYVCQVGTCRDHLGPVDNRGLAPQIVHGPRRCLLRDLQAQRRNFSVTKNKRGHSIVAVVEVVIDHNKRKRSARKFVVAGLRPGAAGRHDDLRPASTGLRPNDAAANRN